MVILQKQVGNKWVDIADTSELVDGDIYRQSVGGHVNPQGDLVGNGWEQKTYITPPPAGAPENFVSMAVFGELLPDEVLVEMEDIKSTSNGPQGGRLSAVRMITHIYSNARVDVLTPEFTAIMNDLVTNTSLTAEQLADIMAALP